MLGAVVGAATGTASALTSSSTDGAILAGGVAAGIFVLGCGNLISEHLFGTTEYALTDGRVVDYSGRFGRTLSAVPLRGVRVWSAWNTRCVTPRHQFCIAS
jgi:hypothetical protein